MQTESTSSTAGSPKIVPGKVTTSDLPPCKVCGENASGFHYGVITCEACKAFFRRCLVRPVRGECRSENKCAVIAGLRHAQCAVCRYQKCITEGMSKTAIRTGRYTHQKRSQNNEEVRQTRYGESKEKERQKEEQDRLIEQITVNHLSHLPSAHFYNTLCEKRKEFMDQYNERESILGNTSKLSKEEYLLIWNSTGIDIDGRRELVSHIVPGMDKSIARFISFAKGLPRFKDLPMDDQIAIIKVSRSHTELLRWSHFMCNETQICYSPHMNGFTHMNDYRKLLPDYHEPLDRMFNLYQRLQGLELTPEEQALLAAISVMNAPASLTHIGWLIRDECVDRLGDALYLLLERRIERPGSTFAQLVDILIELETLDEVHLPGMECSIHENYPGAAKPGDGALLMELTGIKRHDAGELNNTCM